MNLSQPGGRKTGSGPDTDARTGRRVEVRRLSAAREAYINSRPPYEEIETIAGSFEDSDADIDARPYAFDGGETDPNFRGFHRIENLVFAEEDLEAAAGLHALGPKSRRLWDTRGVQ